MFQRIALFQAWVKHAPAIGLGRAAMGPIRFLDDPHQIRASALPAVREMIFRSMDGKAGTRMKSYEVVLAWLKFDIFMDAAPGCF